jgi:hypothetical protein
VTDRDAEARRRRVLILDAIRLACLGGALASGAVALLGPPELAISIVFGTLLGAVNFVLLARGIGAAIDRTVFELERTRRETGREGQLDPVEVVGRPRGAGGMFRLALIVLLVAGVLWYPSTEPLGLALGVLIVLMAASLASLRENQRAQRISQNAS